jgi:dihydroxyacetone kinase-like protein
MTTQAQQTMQVDEPTLGTALARWCDALEQAAPELNALDARLGDGDLGTTLSKCAVNVRALLAQPAPDISMRLKLCAMACAKASGSSFGTLLSVGFMAGAKALSGTERLDAPTLTVALAAAGEALADRGGASIGDKTMLDSLDAVTRALQASTSQDPQALKLAARRACEEALVTYRDQPNRIGRARMFADKSIGLDDPGMVAVYRMVQAL